MGRIAHFIMAVPDAGRAPGTLVATVAPNEVAGLAIQLLSPPDPGEAALANASINGELPRTRQAIEPVTLFLR